MNQTPNSSEENINPEFLSLEKIKGIVNGEIYIHPVHGDVLKVNVKEGVLHIVLGQRYHLLGSSTLEPSTLELSATKFKNTFELMNYINSKK